MCPILALKCNVEAKDSFKTVFQLTNESNGNIFLNYKSTWNQQWNFKTINF